MTKAVLYIFIQIVVNNSYIDVEYAKEISEHINRACLEYGVDAELYTAILAQESMYKVDAKNCNKNGCNDFGISQINKFTAKSYGIEIKRLTTDVEYAIMKGALILSDFKKWYGKKENNWWSRYNSSNEKARERYEKGVNRWMRKF